MYFHIILFVCIHALHCCVLHIFICNYSVFCIIVARAGVGALSGTPLLFHHSFPFNHLINMKKKNHMRILGRDTLMYPEREENVKGLHNELSG